jgi:hypothetical protein
VHLAVENIDHTRTKTKSPQTNGIVERFHKTVLNEFTGSPSGARSTVAWKSYRPISTTGCASTTRVDPIRAAGVTARPRCRPSSTRARWPERRYFLRSSSRRPRSREDDHEWLRCAAVANATA